MSFLLTTFIYVIMAAKKYVVLAIPINLLQCVRKRHFANNLHTQQKLKTN